MRPTHSVGPPGYPPFPQMTTPLRSRTRWYEAIPLRSLNLHSPIPSDQDSAGQAHSHRLRSLGPNPVLVRPSEYLRWTWKSLLRPVPLLSLHGHLLSDETHLQSTSFELLNQRPSHSESQSYTKTTTSPQEHLMTISQNYLRSGERRSKRGQRKPRPDHLRLILGEELPGVRVHEALRPVLGVAVKG